MADPDETPAERLTRLRAKALEHLEAARACIDETGDATSNFLVERAIDELTSQQWPALPDNVVPIWPPQKK